MKIFALLVLLIFIKTFTCFSHPKRENFKKLQTFVSDLVFNELQAHPEMQSIAIVEYKNDFPPEFGEELIKLLPEDISKVIIRPENHWFHNSTLRLTKSSMVIYIVDKIDSVSFF